jgi:FKBP-type peptidyl-prolyl cis-trans isomerase SlyD
MVIESKKVVSVNYVLTSPTAEAGGEELLEKTSVEAPFVFLYGAGGLLEEFEGHLKGLKKGDAFDFRIEAKNAYGLSAPDHVVNIPIEAFRDPEGNIDDEMVNVGNVLPMTDNQGNRLEGLVIERTDDHIKMDFNHPLAGKDLHFKGEVLDVREASEEELAHGHVHGEHGHHH